MVAEVAGGGEEGRPAVFLAAIAGDAAAGPTRPGRCVSRSSVVEGEGEEREIGGAVLALAEARADDDGGDGGLLQHPARRDIGDGDAMPPRHRSSAASTRCRAVPAADLLDEAAVFHLAPVGDVGGGGLGLAEPLLVEQPAGQRAVGEELHAVLEADGAHLFRGAPVEHGEADLVRSDRDAVSLSSSRWSVSKLVTPSAPIRPSSRSAASSRMASM